MCGRYTINIGRARFEQVYAVQAPLGFTERFNVAPTQPAPIIRAGTDGLEAVMLPWGIRRAGSVQPLINARGETVAHLPTFASSFRSRRCLVPASGWFEWQKVGTGKQPHHLHLKDDEPLAFAGIWMPGEAGERFSIITTRASSAIAHVHDRQPVILSKERWKVWFSDAPVAELEAMLEPLESKGLEAYPVSARVGNVRNDDPTIIESLT
jgi:putative SOS response-associated peptidase YedK